MNTQNTIAGIHKDLLGVAVRFAVYTAVLLVVYGSLPNVVHLGDFDIFKEGGPLEWSQFGVLIVAASVFALGAWRIRAFSQWLLFLALLAIFACVRELDSVFDKMLPSFGWQLPAFLVAVGMFLVIWRNPKSFLTQAGLFVRYPGFACLWTGFVVTVIFAQLVGHGAFLEALMGDDYIREYKRVIEELGELFGYCVIFIGSIETVMDAIVSRRVISNQTHMPPYHSRVEQKIGAIIGAG